MNCELNNQVASVSINDPRGAEHSEQRPKSSGMSKSSAKAGKVRRKLQITKLFEVETVSKPLQSRIPRSLFFRDIFVFAVES